MSLYLCVNRRPNALKPSQPNIHRAIALLVFTAAVFRSEVLLLLGPLALQSLLQGYTSFTRLFQIGLVSGLASAGL